MFAASVPDLVALTGRVVPCGNPRGAFHASPGGYAVLGQLIADMTGIPYPEAVAQTVLGPLGMSDSSFPARWPPAASPPGAAAGAVTGYQLAGDGSFEPAPAAVSTLPAAGGLWSTAADLVRFALGWSSLLPGDLIREALRPQVARDAEGVVLASRLVPVEAVNARLLRPIA